MIEQGEFSKEVLHYGQGIQAAIIRGRDIDVYYRPGDFNSRALDTRECIHGHRLVAEVEGLRLAKVEQAPPIFLMAALLLIGAGPGVITTLRPEAGSGRR